MISTNEGLDKSDSIEEIDHTKRPESDVPISDGFYDYLRSTYQVIGVLIIANQIR